MGVTLKYHGNIFSEMIYPKENDLAIKLNTN